MRGLTDRYSIIFEELQCGTRPFETTALSNVAKWCSFYDKASETLGMDSKPHLASHAVLSLKPSGSGSSSQVPSSSSLTVEQLYSHLKGTKSYALQEFLQNGLCFVCAKHANPYKCHFLCKLGFKLVPLDDSDAPRGDCRVGGCGDGRRCGGHGPGRGVGRGDGSRGCGAQHEPSANATETAPVDSESALAPLTSDQPSSALLMRNPRMTIVTSNFLGMGTITVLILVGNVPDLSRTCPIPWIWAWTGLFWGRGRRLAC